MTVTIDIKRDHKKREKNNPKQYMFVFGSQSKIIFSPFVFCLIFSKHPINIAEWNILMPTDSYMNQDLWKNDGGSKSYREQQIFYNMKQKKM